MNLDNLPTKEYLKLRKDLVRYVARFQQDVPHDYMTFRQAAKRFKITHANIEHLIEDEVQLAYNIGILIPGHGHYVYENTGEYTIEYDGEPLLKKKEKVIWRVYDAGFSGSFYAERVIDGQAIETKNLSAHCLACAKSDIMAETGEKVDMRGWHKQKCGPFAKAMALTSTLPDSFFDDVHAGDIVQDL
ncbi:MAG TPA: hypothetical protein ENI23_07515 [bacterium]|nr:hypothetical protein [bacterium]